MKKFRLLSLVVCISILCMALTGCVGTVTSQEEKETALLVSP